ncbi:MAG: hypothetical protein NTZ83_04700 [Candidatus Pacearchaeota archaeon]|nr:hypothetical protein [Candidatus Pacearchaeota archaeon]
MTKKSVEKKTIIREVTSDKEPKKTIIKEITSEKKPKRRPASKRVIHVHTNPEIENVLVSNFVSLQKVMVNLSTKFEELTNQISKLLELFEISAKALAEKDFDVDKNNRDNTKLLEKLENVLEQNKTIARGLTLMHDKITEPLNSQTYYPSQLSMSRMQPQIQQQQSFKPAQKTSLVGGVSEEFHRPISSNEQ